MYLRATFDVTGMRHRVRRELRTIAEHDFYFPAPYVEYTGDRLYYRTNSGCGEYRLELGKSLVVEFNGRRRSFLDGAWRIGFKPPEIPWDPRVWPEVWFSLPYLALFGRVEEYRTSAPDLPLGKAPEARAGKEEARRGSR